MASGDAIFDQLRRRVHRHRRLRPPPIAHAARLLRPDDEPVEVGLDRVAGQLELVLPEQQRQDRLDLQDGERVAQALVAPAAERDVGEVALVLFARRREAIGIEARRGRGTPSGIRCDTVGEMTIQVPFGMNHCL